MTSFKHGSIESPALLPTTMSATTTTASDIKDYAKNTRNNTRDHSFASALSPFRFFYLLLSVAYILVQRVIVYFFKPRVPQTEDYPKKAFGRIAVIGAGLTGVSSAAHAISHGFDVVIYESDERVGGIWAHVNSTSGLQLNSTLYRFHPGVLWSKGFPLRDEILSEITRLWKEYKLESRTRFKTPVTSVRRADTGSSEDIDPSRLGHARWLINNGSDGSFDAVIVTVGTCGKPRLVHFDGMPSSSDKLSDNEEDGQGSKHGYENGRKEDENVFENPILHSSQLDTVDEGKIRGKIVVVIGSGASAVESVETAMLRGAEHCVVVARDDKWIIPRNMLIDTLIAAQPFGREMPLSFLWEKFLKRWQYHGVEYLVPPHKGLFESTPVVNDVFLDYVRNNKCTYLRGDTLRLTKRGVMVSVRERMSKAGDPGKEQEVDADVVVLATGFEKPSVEFLPKDLFPDDYQRPDLYLQNFATEDWSILMTNSSYMNAIGTVGHFHIGIYTRILLTLLLDKNARPTPRDMKLWVDVVRFLKRGASGGALGFFTYMELTIWLLLFHLLRPDRIRWLFFIMQGWGVYPKE